MVKAPKNNLFNFYIICILYFISVLHAYTQNTLCNDNDCGDVFATYSPVGSNVFCEGATVILKIPVQLKISRFFILIGAMAKKIRLEIIMILDTFILILPHLSDANRTQNLTRLSAT